jgi:hypothetical protein
MSERVQFGRGMAAAGVPAGVAIALGLPALLLIFGQFLGAIVITILIVLALIIGGGLAIVSAFFGTVIPKEVTHGDAAPGSGGPPK